MASHHCAAPANCAIQHKARQLCSEGQAPSTFPLRQRVPHGPLCGRVGQSPRSQQKAGHHHTQGVPGSRPSRRHGPTFRVGFSNTPVSPTPHLPADGTLQQDTGLKLRPSTTALQHTRPWICGFCQQPVLTQPMTHTNRLSTCGGCSRPTSQLSGAQAYRTLT